LCPRRLQDKFSLYTGYSAAIGISIIAGSLFLKIPQTSSGAFTRGGALFIALLFNSFTAFAALPTQMMGRPILQKQVGYALFRPLRIVWARSLRTCRLARSRSFFSV
jgi:hypothetical protein